MSSDHSASMVIWTLGGVSLLTVLLARVIDRFGKGVRDAPRGALLADVVPVHGRGGGFGLRLAFYTAGYVVGPLVAMTVLRMSGGNFRLVFWLATIPVMLGVLLVVWKVREKGASAEGGSLPLT